MLHRTATAIAKVLAGRSDAVGTGGLDLDNLGMIAVAHHADRLARQTKGHIDPRLEHNAVALGADMINLQDRRLALRRARPHGHPLGAGSLAMGQGRSGHGVFVNLGLGPAGIGVRDAYALFSPLTRGVVGLKTWATIRNPLTRPVRTLLMEAQARDLYHYVAGRLK